MKNVMYLTFDEGIELVKVLHEAAVDNGWSEEEVDDCGVIEEYSHAVDKVLNALGIEVKIDPTPDEEEEEDDDEDYSASYNGYSYDEDDAYEEDDEWEGFSDAEVFFIRAIMIQGYSREEAIKMAKTLFRGEEGE